MLHIWLDAFIQSVLSVGPIILGVMTERGRLATNSFSPHLTVVMIFVNLVMSLLCSIITSAALGDLAAMYDTNLTDVVRNGPGVSVIAYSHALTHLPFPPIWSVLFFLVLAFLSLPSIHSLIAVPISITSEIWPKKHRLVTVIWTTALFIVGLVFFTNMGVYLVCVTDHYALTWGTLAMGIAECGTVCWLYGRKHWKSDIHGMIGEDPWNLTLVAWSVVSPLAIMGTLVFSWASYKPPECGSVDLPTWMEVLGGFVALMPLFVFLIHAAYSACVHGKGDQLD
ncbi:unnamed protein product [Darwinula stevensoni]|uniref:Uncharacterized protein n=1 Tax=Darwinula stevensoni TaxID=69355 RepID=A0A7R9A1U0_9CRUS|nr:unnamed protein product [Darwinula stevensoni]CAG0887299.1 unnamed protein product [Darwinula stevensoni]